MAKQNLAELSDSDLLELLDETKDELLNLRFQIVTGQLDNNQRRTTRTVVIRDFAVRSYFCRLGNNPRRTVRRDNARLLLGTHLYHPAMARRCSNGSVEFGRPGKEPVSRA